MLQIEPDTDRVVVLLVSTKKLLAYIKETGGGEDIFGLENILLGTSTLSDPELLQTQAEAGIVAIGIAIGDSSCLTPPVTRG